MRASLFLAALLLASTAQAGLRPIYGGDLVVWSPTEPQTSEPAKAWSTIELVLANATGGSLEDLLEEPPSLTGSTLHMTLRADAAWADGTAIDARGLARLLQASLNASPVALPPFTFKASGKEVLAELPTALTDEERYLTLPWLRVTRGDDGPFRHARGGYLANSNGIGGRPFVDRILVETHEGRKAEPPPEGVALSQPGADGRPIFALTKQNGPAAPLLRAALAAVDRTSLARFFVRTPAHVPEGWPVPAATEASGEATVVLAVDSSEKDLKTVAERLQILLKKQNVTVRIASDDRAGFFARLTSGNYDLALIALPPAPPLVQAATLVRYTEGREAADRFWATPENAAAAFDSAAVLHTTAATESAVLLYMEDGRTIAGPRVRMMSVPVWELDPAELWLLPAAETP